MRKLLMFLLATGAIAVACTQATPPPPAPEPQTAAPPPPPMAGKLVLYGDLAFFQGRGQPENCILKSRYKRGEPVGFRMTAIDPLTGLYAETADLTVHLSYAGITETIEMRYRGAGENPRPGFWTAKWVVPDDAPVGIVSYKVTGADKDGRSGEFKPFDVELSQLAIVE